MSALIVLKCGKTRSMTALSTNENQLPHLRPHMAGGGGFFLDFLTGATRGSFGDQQLFSRLCLPSHHAFMSNPAPAWVAAVKSGAKRKLKSPRIIGHRGRGEWGVTPPHRHSSMAKMNIIGRRSLFENQSISLGWTERSRSLWPLS